MVSTAYSAPLRWLIGLVLTLALLPLPPALAAQPAAQPTALPQELVLEGDNIITLWVNGEPLRMEVTADSFGAPVINSEVAARLALVPTQQRGWQFGSVIVRGLSAVVDMDFGAGPAPTLVSWAERFASRKADGVIGVQSLPYKRVTFLLGTPAGDEIMHRFAIKRSGRAVDERIGTEVMAGKQRLMMIFAQQRPENLVTAPTANFIATHQEGGFEALSDGIAVMNFAVERPTRMMRLAVPIMLGELPVDRFAVRVEDYGKPRRVGEIGENDPRFAPGNITVSRRKGRGKPDLLTRIGRDQIAHCSSLTYDLEASEIRLSCAADAP
jgi:hypothetical protein